MINKLRAATEAVLEAKTSYRLSPIKRMAYSRALREFQLIVTPEAVSELIATIESLEARLASALALGLSLQASAAAASPPAAADNRTGAADGPDPSVAA